MTSKKRIVRNCIIWILIIALHLQVLNLIFLPKNTDALAATTVINGFYAEEKDSLDVVFFGSSQVALGISPMEIYEKYGIKSYNLTTGDQPIAATYYWVKEAYKRQKNMTAVIDIDMATNETGISEAAFIEAIDYMHWGLNRLGAIHAVTSLYKQNKWDFYVPFLRFHSRWSELSGKDFSYLLHRTRTNVKKGQYPLASLSAFDYRGIDDDPEAGIETEDGEPIILERNEKYLRKTAEFCREKGIKLVFIKTPITIWTAEQHNAVEELSESLDVPFLDMNMKPYPDSIGLDPKADYQGTDHLNILGAEKVSTALGQYLLDNHYVSIGAMKDGTGKGVEEQSAGESEVGGSGTDIKNSANAEAGDTSWNAQTLVWDHIRKNAKLPLEMDVDKYRDIVRSDEDYTVFMLYQDNGSADYTEEYAKMLSDWGIDEETTCSRKTLFIEITDRGENIVRKESDQEIRWSGAIGQDQKCTADIEVLPTGVKFMYDGVDHSVPNANGLHIIVYSNSEDRIIDSVCFTPVSNGDVYWSIRNF